MNTITLLAWRYNSELNRWELVRFLSFSLSIYAMALSFVTSSSYFFYGDSKCNSLVWFILFKSLSNLILCWWRAVTITKFYGYLILESIQIIVYARNKKKCVRELKRLLTTKKIDWFFLILNEKVDYELSNKESWILFLSHFHIVQMWKHRFCFCFQPYWKKFCSEKECVQTIKLVSNC